MVSIHSLWKGYFDQMCIRDRRCSMHTGHKAVLNDETEWVRLENHHTAIIDRVLFENCLLYTSAYAETERKDE